MSRDQTSIPGLYYGRVHNSRTYEQVRSAGIIGAEEESAVVREEAANERDRVRRVCIVRLNDLVGQCKRRGLI